MPYGKSTRLVRAAVSLWCVVSCAYSSHPETRDPVDRENRTSDRVVYVGAYTGPGVAPDGQSPSIARGIYVFRMRAADGHLTLVQVMPTDNPSFLALDPTLSHLYCTNQNDVVDGIPAGRVSAFAVNATSGELRLLNSGPTHGAHPAHLSVHPSGRYLLASNYGEGDYPIYRILADGRLGPETGDPHGTGIGPVRDRQEGPHAHQILTDPDAHHVFGVDLGADQIRIWNLDLATGELTPNGPAALALPPGSGPRHMVFHPNRKLAYVLNELSGTVSILQYDAVRGVLALAGTVSTLPPSFTGPKSSSEIRIHPSGRFLYATNRGNDSIAMFAIDETTGGLRTLGWVPTQGKWPRGMNIDPSGQFLYVANQNSDSIVVFRIDATKGGLEPTGEIVRTPTPVDIEFGERLYRGPLL